MKNNILQNADNYNKILTTNVFDIYNKFTSIINEFILHMLDNNKSVNVEIELYEGIKTLTHVFKFLILYTKNLDLTLYHCQRAFYFFIEFMDQMNDESHSFLQLSIKDAILFVYKKTIYDINDDYRSNYSIEITEDEKILDVILNIYVEIALLHIIKCKSQDNKLKYLSDENEKLIKNINKVYQKNKNNKTGLYQKMTELNLFINQEVKTFTDIPLFDQKIKTFRK
jgi:hypothetical protein